MPYTNFIVLGYQGTERIEGIVLNLPLNEEREELNVEPFSKMNKLRLLNISKLHISCLSNLSNELRLLECNEYLPLSTQFVSAQGCISIKNYSNQVVVWTSDAARFTFINCHGLADDEKGKIGVPLLNIHFQSLWQRYMEVSLSLSLSCVCTH